MEYQQCKILFRQEVFEKPVLKTAFKALPKDYTFAVGGLWGMIFNCVKIFTRLISLKFISNTSNTDNKFRIFRIVFNFLSQIRYVRIYCARVNINAVAPDIIKY